MLGDAAAFAASLVECAPQIEYLNASYNAMVGVFPPDFAQLTQLRRLDLSSNQLTGSLPFDLGKLRHLRFFSVWRNKLSGGFCRAAVLRRHQTKLDSSVHLGCCAVLCRR